MAIRFDDLTPDEQYRAASARLRVLDEDAARLAVTAAPPGMEHRKEGMRLRLQAQSRDVEARLRAAEARLGLSPAPTAPRPSRLP